MKLKAFLLAAACTSLSSNALEISRPPHLNPDPEGELALSGESILVAAQSQPTDVSYLGEGYDLIRGNRRSSRCITYGGAEISPINFAKSNLSEITDEEMYLRKTNNSISAKASYGGWSGGGAYTQNIETKTSATKTTLVAKADYITHAVNIKPEKSDAKAFNIGGTRIDLTPEMVKLITSGKFVEFRNECGDGYIGQIAYGAYFISTLEFSNLDFSEKKDIEMALSATGPGDLFKADASSKIQSESQNKKTKLSIDTWQYGGNFDSLPSTKEGIIEAYRQLPAIAKSAPSQLYLTVVRYDSLPAFSSFKKNQVQYWFYASQVQTSILRLQSVRNDLAEALADITSSAGSNPSNKSPKYAFFPKIEEPKRGPVGIRKSLLQMEAQIKALGQWLNTCMSKADASSCAYNKSFDDIGYSDLYWKAHSPALKSDIAPDVYADISSRASGSPDFQRDAKCYLAFIQSMNSIRRTATLRQRYDGNVNEEQVNLAILEIYNQLDIAPADCSAVLPTSSFQINAEIDVADDINSSGISSVEAKAENDKKNLIKKTITDSLLLPFLGIQP